jgi:hypothetical protein
MFNFFMGMVMPYSGFATTIPIYLLPGLTLPAWFAGWP